MFPDSLTDVSDFAFWECASLESVIFGEKSKLEKIGIGAFGCTGLKTFIAPRSLRTIAQGAFRKCEKLRHVILNDGLEVIGTNEHADNKYYGVF